MPSWNELVEEIQKIADSKQGVAWLAAKQKEWLEKLSAKRGGRNVLFYASGFLQKPQAAPIFLQIAPEDINGFMAGLHGMDYSKGLTIILHTPGGITNATETIVEYLHSKFTDIEVIIPAYAMSAGTMISLAANRLIMGKQSQLGPIDPQIPSEAEWYQLEPLWINSNKRKKILLPILERPHCGPRHCNRLGRLC